jgi:hypothetical protein
LETYRLICHPGTPQSALWAVEVILQRRGVCCLSLSFRALGGVGEIAWPGGEAVGFGDWDRQDELWQHSCFEAFVRPAGLSSYIELNFATSGRWAAYAFTDYRQGMMPLEDITLHSASWQIQKARTDLNAVLGLPQRYLGMDWELGVSAVIETKGGQKSYWALAHPSGKPDFHHADCFAAILPAPDAP